MQKLLCVLYMLISCTIFIMAGSDSLQPVKKMKVSDQDTLNADFLNAAHSTVFNVQEKQNALIASLDAKADISTVDNNGMTALRTIIIHSKQEENIDSIVKLLINSRSPLQSPMGMRSTPLCASILSNKVSIAKILIQAGADVNARDEHDSLLHMLTKDCNMNDSEVCTFFTVMNHTNTLNIDQSNIEGDTPLCLAVPNIQNRMSLISMLFAHGATPYCPSDKHIQLTPVAFPPKVLAEHESWKLEATNQITPCLQQIKPLVQIIMDYCFFKRSKQSE